MISLFALPKWKTDPSGKRSCEGVRKNDDKLLVQYEKNWLSMFGDEFEKMLLARKLLERLDNKAMDELFSAVSPEKLEEVSAHGDFDFHSAALTKILGAKSAARIVKALLGNEIRRLIDNN